VHYCYDDADLKKLQRTFPANASYNLQRFKGMIQSYFVFTLLALELFVGLYYNFCQNNFFHAILAYLIVRVDIV